mmetsp:Transcript_53272/g.159489  ORF Transcript_53272/g.159489 Transcript_53272/m.159489 type:complete len:345 (-) Transcript_53272:669-1703(-)
MRRSRGRSGLLLGRQGCGIDDLHEAVPQRGVAQGGGRAFGGALIQEGGEDAQSPIFLVVAVRRGRTLQGVGEGLAPRPGGQPPRPPPHVVVLRILVVGGQAEVRRVRRRAGVAPRGARRANVTTHAASRFHELTVAEAAQLRLAELVGGRVQIVRMLVGVAGVPHVELLQVLMAQFRGRRPPIGDGVRARIAILALRVGAPLRRGVVADAVGVEVDWSRGPLRGGERAAAAASAVGREGIVTEPLQSHVLLLAALGCVRLSRSVPSPADSARHGLRVERRPPYLQGAVLRTLMRPSALRGAQRVRSPVSGIGMVRWRIDLLRRLLYVRVEGAVLLLRRRLLFLL